MDRGSRCDESSMKMDGWRNGRGTKRKKARPKERKRSGERKRPVGTGNRPEVLVSGERGAAESAL